MLALGLQLTLRSGREALVRLIVTAVAVGVGVVLLLAVFADFHAFQQASGRPCWECTAPAADQSALTPTTLLWNFSENIYQGQFIEQLEIAPLGSNAQVPPGLPRMPKAGEFYASPALAALIDSVPADELGDRFPGTMVGTIGHEALTGPGQLAIVIGVAPDQLAAMPGTWRTDQIAMAPQTQGTTNLYRMAFGLGAIALLFPILILIATATRLAATRREERFAALRLVGATPAQIGVVASVDAVVSALAGTLLGIGVFQLIQPPLANVALSGARFFPETVTPAVLGYLGMLIVVPVASAVAALVSLRRVQLSPLGVSRKVTPNPPRPWRVIPLIAGFALVAAFLIMADPTSLPNPMPLFLGLLLVMGGLMLAGPWLTMQGARLLGRYARGASPLLAARHLADNPQAAFRSISGLVLAVFIGTGIAVLAPTLNVAQSGGSDTSLNDVLRVPISTPLTSDASAQLLSKLGAFPGVSLLPIYRASADTPHKITPGNPPVEHVQATDCASLAAFPAIGACPAGASAVSFSGVDSLFTDNPLVTYKALPIVDANASPETADLSTLPLTALLIKTTDAHSLERIRTFLTTYSAATGMGHPPYSGENMLTAWQQGSLEPQTFGEVAQVRNNDDTNIQRIVLLGVGITLLVAGCSLAVSVGGSIVERKRPFSLLHLSGTPMGVLYRAVLQESILPLAAAALVAGAIGGGVGALFIGVLAPPGTPISMPSGVYYITMAVGLAVSLLVISATLPLLARITQSDNARFE